MVKTEEFPEPPKCPNPKCGSSNVTVSKQGKGYCRRCGHEWTVKE